MTDTVDTTQSLKDSPEEPLLSSSPATDQNPTEKSDLAPTEELKPNEDVQDSTGNPSQEQEQVTNSEDKKPEEAEQAKTEARIQFKLKSFTTVMILINVGVFLATTAYSILTEQDAVGETCLLYKLGADQTHSMLANGELYRLIIPLFLHGGIKHILFNTLSLALDGYYLEAKFGAQRIAIFYFLTGIGGNLLSATNFNIGISLGASGALMGLFGLRLILLIESYFSVSSDKKSDVVQQAMKMGESLLPNIISTADNKGVDVTAHFGGFIVGVFLALRFVQWGKGRMSSFIKAMATVMTVIFVLYCCVFLLGVGNFLNEKGLLKKVSEQYRDLCYPKQNSTSSMIM